MFVIECKQFTKKQRASKAWNLGMQAALGQALGYAKNLEVPPVFVIACDVGRAALSDPRSLDPSHQQVEITKEVAATIGFLARELRAAGHDRELVARFLMRCLFTMFAEDVGLFEGRKKVFEEYLRDYWIKNPASFANGASDLWQTMRECPALC